MGNTSECEIIDRNSWVYDKGYIYKITSIINNKIYIGSTINWYNRRKTHFSKLRLNYHGNKNLQKDFNIYGENNFEFTILEEITYSNIKNLHEKEQYYFDNLNPEYNISKIAGSNKGYIMSEEIIKIRTQKQVININQYDLEGNFIREWDSSKDVERELGFDSKNIRECCRGIRKSSRGYIWKNK